MAVGVGVVGCFAFCGNSCIQAYMSVVLEGAGLSEASARAGAITYASTQFVFAVLMALYGVARFGRRPLLIASAMCATAALTAMATFTETQEGLSASLAADAYIAAVTLGLSTLSWVYCAEVLPDSERGRGMAYATCLFWATTFASLQLFDVAVATLTVAGILGLFALYYLMPLFVMVTTSLKSLDEIRTGDLISCRLTAAIVRIGGCLRCGAK